MIKISIIVPVYNVEKYLSECLDSLLNQTLKEIEIILVDDESTDQSPIICNQYAEKDSRIKVIHKKNAGLGFARNSGLEVISGEYVLMVDSDDMLKPDDALEKLYGVCKQDSLDACFFCFTRFSADGEYYINDGCLNYTIFDTEKKVRQFCLNMVGAPPTYKKDCMYEFSACKVLYSTKIIKDNNLRFVSENQYASEDIFWNVDYLCHSKKIAFLPKGYYYYRYNPLSISHTQSDKKIKALQESASYMKGHLQKYFSKSDSDLSYKRFLLRTLRLSLKAIYFSNHSRIEKIKWMKGCLQSEYFFDMFEAYPYKQLPLVPKIYYLLAKYRKVCFIYAILHFMAKK